MLNELTHGMVGTRAVFPMEKKDLKKTVDPHDLFVLPLVEAVVTNEGSLNILKSLSDSKKKRKTTWKLTAFMS
jgi:hypothetical protein